MLFLLLGTKKRHLRCLLMSLEENARNDTKGQARKQRGKFPLRGTTIAIHSAIRRYRQSLCLHIDFLGVWF